MSFVRSIGRPVWKRTTLLPSNDRERYAESFNSDAACNNDIALPPSLVVVGYLPTTSKAPIDIKDEDIVGLSMVVVQYFLSTGYHQEQSEIIEEVEDSEAPLNLPLSNNDEVAGSNPDMYPDAMSVTDIEVERASMHLLKQENHGDTAAHVHGWRWPSRPSCFSVGSC